jgi:transposase-like protein
MKINCPHSECSSHSNPSPQFKPIVRNGYFYRASDSRWMTRYFCRACQSYFSTATDRPDRYQKKRRINRPLYELHCSNTSQRRLALFFRVDRKTVVRKIRFLAELSRARQEEDLNSRYKDKPLALVQFDDLETSEHTKMKPLSVTLAVDPKARKILKFQVSSMPAKGLLAEKARKKYGPRVDERPEGWDQFMKGLIPYVKPDCVWTSDENPHYPRYLKKHHPLSRHIQVKGGRGAMTGQGELKKLHFDPIFSLNHTCAMLRANMHRLIRKTWNTTKTKRGLIDHLSLYVSYHNEVLTEPVRS